jgi:hypothetical protein
MRGCAFVWVLIVAMFVCGCDPGGLRRVDLDLASPPSQDNIIAVDSPDAQKALQFLDLVVAKRGWHLAETEAGYVRVYSLNYPKVSEAYTHTTHCRVMLTSNGFHVTFGEPGFLGGDPEAESLFVDVRNAFIKRYGKEHIRSHRLGVS